LVNRSSLSKGNEENARCIGADERNICFTLHKREQTNDRLHASSKLFVLYWYINDLDMDKITNKVKVNAVVITAPRESGDRHSEV